MSTHLLGRLSIICLFTLLGASWVYASPPQKRLTFRVITGVGLESGERSSRDEERIMTTSSLDEPRVRLGVGVDGHQQYFFWSVSYVPMFIIGEHGLKDQNVTRAGLGYYEGKLGVDFGVNATFTSKGDTLELLPYLNIATGRDDLYYGVSVNSSRNRNFAIGFDQSDWMLDLKVGSLFERTGIELGVSLRGLSILGVGGFWEQLFYINETTKIGYDLQAMFNEEFNLNIGRTFDEAKSFNVSANLLFSKAL